MKKILGPQQIVEDFLFSEGGLAESERLVCYYLDEQRCLIANQKIAEGKMSECKFLIRDIFKFAFQYEASFIIMAHNHPTNNPCPSELDVDSTLQIIEISKRLLTPLIDHVVVAPNGDSRSMYEMGMIE